MHLHWKCRGQSRLDPEKRPSDQKSAERENPFIQDCTLSQLPQITTWFSFLNPQSKSQLNHLYPLFESLELNEVDRSWIHLFLVTLFLAEGCWKSFSHYLAALSWHFRSILSTLYTDTELNSCVCCTVLARSVPIQNGNETKNSWSDMTDRAAANEDGDRLHKSHAAFKHLWC